MDALLFADVQRDSDDSWSAFELEHGLQHQTVQEAMLRNDFQPFYLDLYVFPRDDDQGYLLDHYQTHLSNAQLLGLPDIPDLSTYDLNRPSEWQDWAALHAQVHANENTILGLI